MQELLDFYLILTFVMYSRVTKNILAFIFRILFVHIFTCEWRQTSVNMPGGNAVHMYRLISHQKSMTITHSSLHDEYIVCSSPVPIHQSVRVLYAMLVCKHVAAQLASVDVATL